MKDEMFDKLCDSVEQAIAYARMNSTVLSDRDRDRFLDALDEEEPNENLKEAARRHDEIIRSGDSNG